MDAIEAIMTTRTMRRYSDRPVSDDDLWTCLRAAQQAPTGGNVQPQQYVVICDPQVRSDLGRIYREAYERYEAALPTPAGFRDAAAEASYHRTREAGRHLAAHLGDVPVIVLFLQPIMPWGMRDADGPIDIGRLDASIYPAVQNFCLAARALGLGTALTTAIRCRTDDVFALLGVPAGKFEIAALTPLGHPTGSFGVARRRPVEKTTHLDRWGATVAPG